VASYHYWNFCCQCCSYVSSIRFFFFLTSLASLLSLSSERKHSSSASSLLFHSLLPCRWLVVAACGLPCSLLGESCRGAVIVKLNPSSSFGASRPATTANSANWSYAFRHRRLDGAIVHSFLVDHVLSWKQIHNLVRQSSVSILKAIVISSIFCRFLDSLATKLCNTDAHTTNLLPFSMRPQEH
jgi:hypothetical protein